MKNIRWKRWVAGVVGVLALYAALGFWLLPWVIEDQIPKIGQSQLKHKASVGKVSFNPFTLALEAADLRLAQPDGVPLLAVGKLKVELLWRSITRRAWSFAQINISEPRLNLLIAADGKFNWAQLLDAINRQPQQASSDNALPRLVIEQFKLEQGKVEMRDLQAGYANVFTPVQFTLSHFSTLPKEGDTHLFSAQSTSGAKLLWNGRATVNPIQGSGELSLETAPLAELGVYLKPYTRAALTSGQLSFTLPYTFAYAAGKFEAAIAGAKLSLRDLALSHAGAAEPFAALTRLDVTGVDADLVRREATVGEVRVEGGKIKARRDAKGDIDLTRLMIDAAPQTAPQPTPQPTPQPPAAAKDNNWKLAVKKINIDQFSVNAVDETVNPPLQLAASKLGLQLQLQASQQAEKLQLEVNNATGSASELSLASGTRSPFKLARLGFDDASLDLAARRVAVGRVYAQEGQLQVSRDRKGQIDLLALLPKADGAPPAAAPPTQSAGAPWKASVKVMELTKFEADVQDEDSGLKLYVTDLAARLDGASNDLKQAVKFDASLRVREGGQLSAQGSVVPDSGALQADMVLTKLALAPAQSVLAKYLKLKIAGGDVSAKGRLTAGDGTARNASLRYVGSLDVAGLMLNETDGELFASWKNVGAERLTASIGPNLLDIPELRVLQANAKLIIEDDRSLNAARLLVQPASPAAAPAPAASAPTDASEPFPMRIRRVRLQDAKLDFTDLSLRPQFSAKIQELNGVVNGLSSSVESRSQIELDGRVDEFGLARIRGELNPFAPRNNTDINVVFKNVDLVPTTPYSMKFAGYKIAEGKISLDLQYKVRNSKLEGENQIIIDRLTLGERVESPDALKIPLELAIAILKDSDGRIELGLPVSGDISDPQFSYGALIWKAIGNVLGKSVTAPFRAIGALLGISGEKLESVDFDPGSSRLLPPEREKLKQISQLLTKRPQLHLSVPASYSQAGDGAAMRARAVRVELARRANIKLDAGEEPGPLDLSSRAMRTAVRELYATRFGQDQLDLQMKEAERAAGVPSVPSAPSAPSAQSQTPQDTLPLVQRMGRLVQGEPQVADAGPFYNKLMERLNQNQSLPENALAQLATQRAELILASLKESGVDAARLTASAPQTVSSDVGKSVPVALGLAGK